MSLVEVRADDSYAIATTEPIVHRGRHGLLLFVLAHRPDGTWLVGDVDYETPEGLKKEIARFIANAPTARVLLEPKP